MLDRLKSFLSGLDYGSDYIALWITSTMVFLAVALGPAFLYIIFLSDIDKSVKTAIRKKRRRLDPEDPEYDEHKVKRRGRRRKRLLSRRVVMVHLPVIGGLVLVGTLVALGLTRLLSTT